MQSVMKNNNQDYKQSSDQVKSQVSNNKDDPVETMLDFNALQYDMYPDLSVVVDRTTKTSYTQKNEYSPGQIMQIWVNSGSDFIDTRESYLAVDLEVSFDDTSTFEEKQTVHYDFGRTGSAFNIIKSIQITDRSGNELERINNVNHLANILIRETNPKDFLQTTGSTFYDSYGDEKYKDLSLGYTVAVSGQEQVTTRRFLLPLKYLSGLFDYNQLLPSQLMSGMRIQIEFEKPEMILKEHLINSTIASTVTPPSLTMKIKNTRLMLDSVKLTDSIMRELNRRSAQNGLEIMYRTWYTDVRTISSNEINFESRKAVSRAFGAILKVSPVGYDTLSQDSFKSSDFSFVEWQWRAGNLYFPHQKLEGTKENLGRETFYHVKKYFGRCKKKSSTFCSVEDYSSGVVRSVDRSILPDNTTFAQFSSLDKLNFIPVDLERTTVQDLSGIPLNNSRVLTFNGRTGDDEYANETAHLFLNYLKVARVFMENTEVEE